MDYTVLIRAPLFKGLMVAEIMSVMALIPYRIRKYKAGAMISQTGDPVNYFMMVLEGTVKGEMVDYSGRVIKIEDVTPSGALAAAFIFGSRSRFPVNVVAVTDASLLVIDKLDFIRFLKGNDKLLINFLDMISDRSQFLSEKIKFLNFKTIKGKLAQYILQIAGNNTTEMKLIMTQGELADYFGVARPSIARVISGMESEGIIYTKGKYIRILDKEKLVRLTEE